MRRRHCALAGRDLLEEGLAGRKTAPSHLEIGGRLYMVYGCLDRKVRVRRIELRVVFVDCRQEARLKLLQLSRRAGSSV